VRPLSPLSSARWFRRLLCILPLDFRSDYGRDMEQVFREQHREAAEAEAFATYVHARVRDDWGHPDPETTAAEDLHIEKHRGIRPAPGYPACPDHSEKFDLFQFLQAQKQGMALTESGAMTPAASVSGFYFSHPQAKYFNVGRIGLDQVESYAQRRGMPMDEVEKWLSPNLSYERAEAGVKC